MSEYLMQWYRPIVDALLDRYGLSVDDGIRHMLASTIMHNRANPCPASVRKHSPMPALQKALTHVKALLQYADKPPSRASSLVLRARKLAEALRENALVGMELVLTKPSFNPLPLLDALDAGNAERIELLRLLATLEVATGKAWKVGRPWAAFTVVIRAGCITWQRAGKRVQSRWSVDEETLSGELPDFLRDLIACCNGTHELVRSLWTERLRLMARRGHADPRQAPKGDSLAVSDMAIRDAIRAYQAWCRAGAQKIEPFSLDSKPSGA